MKATARSSAPCFSASGATAQADRSVVGGAVRTLSIVAVGHTYVQASYRGKWRQLSANLGCAVTLIVPTRWQETFWTGHPDPEPADSGVRLVVLPIAFSGRNYAHAYLSTFLPLLARLRPDVVHVEEEPWSVAAAQFVLGARLATPDARRLVFTWENAPIRQSGVKGWLERLTLRLVDCAIAGSTQASEVLRFKGYRGRVCTLPQHGYDEERFRTGLASPRAHPRFRVGYAGRLVPEKGVSVLLRAHALLPPDVDLVLVGTGPEEPSLRTLARELGTAERVRFAGQLGRNDLPDAYRSLDVLVLASLTIPDGWREQYGRVLVEAMACGVPVIGSSSGAIPEVVGPAGLIAEEGNAADLAAAIQRIKDDADLRERLGSEGASRARRFYSDRAISARTANLYRELLANSGSRTEPCSTAP